MGKEVKGYMVKFIITIGKLIMRLIREAKFPKEKIITWIEKYKRSIIEDSKPMPDKIFKNSQIKISPKEGLELRKENEKLKRIIIYLLKE